MHHKEKYAVIVGAELQITRHQIEQTVALLDDGNTVPFIARYRKEVTGGLDEVQIRQIEDRMRYLRNLTERKETILESIDKQEKLTPDLRDKIENAERLQELEDIYLPYRPKRRTRATVARERGLEPLAELLLDQAVTTGGIEEQAGPFVDADRGVASTKLAYAGARDIVAERLSEDAEVRQEIRKWTLRTGMLKCTARKDADLSVYEMYADYREAVKQIRPHRVLAINRGEREGFLRVAIEVESQAAVQIISKRFHLNARSIFCGELEQAISDAYDRLIAPAIGRDIRHELTELADEHAITVFAENVKNLFLAAPLRHRTIMGIDPGFRTGCKVAIISETGKYLRGFTIYPHDPQKRRDEAKKQLRAAIDEHHVDIVAIGNGTACRETEQLVAEVIATAKRKLHYIIVSEAGASVYSASAIAREEFPDLPVEMRGNISIARRLLDPLSELVKIDPKSIGVGLYQHDVNQNRLSESLDRVVESAVNYVGVDLNTASPSLLKYVAGINNRTAQNIVAYREQNGSYKSRKELTKVKGLGESTFIQAAGFLRIPDGEDFFDSTAVHPESYPAARALLRKLQIDDSQVREEGQLLGCKLEQTQANLAQMAAECGTGLPTLLDIIESLEKPNRDPRDEMPKPILRSDILKIEDLKEGTVLKGTVRNVVDFGAFVDIGLKSDGLVHKSKMSPKYVKNPMDIVAVGDVIDVRVVRIDIDKQRIALSMVLDKTERTAHR